MAIDAEPGISSAQASPHAASTRAVVFAGLATVAISLIFAALPSIDLKVSWTFLHIPGGFVAAGYPWLRLLRSTGLWSVNLTIIAVAALTIARCLLPIRLQPAALAGLRPRVLTFLTASVAIGPGIIANLILKDHWGRARPIDTDLFGGTHPFTLPWVMSDACARNCSFVSGEASGVFWLVAFAFIVPKRYRILVAALTFCWASIISLNRIAFGGHYLSDVIIGWSLTLVVILAARDLILIRWGNRIDAAVARWTGDTAARGI